ncbi:MAG: glycosyltransferase [Phycisphaerae bacterium]|jgi:tetratricopeptide (TPR) repeat protein
MDFHTDGRNYQDALKLAEQGDYGQAFECIENYLRNDSGNPEIWNDAGAILHCLGKTDQAIEYFNKANALKPNNAEVLSNLAEAYLAVQRPGQAAELFAQMQNIGMLNPDLINRTATALLDSNDKACATEVLLQSLAMWPQQQVLKPMLDVIRSKRPRIAFFCGADGMNFLQEIIEFAKKRFNVRVFEGKTEDELYELMQWSDISWFEWCTNLAAIGSNKPKVCKMIVRLHRYEAYGNWPAQVNWRNVDTLITIGNPVVAQTLTARTPGIAEMTNIVSIPNGVNLEKFKFVDRRKGKNIAFLANLRMVKNPAFLIQCMQKLNYIDKEYKLFIAGNVVEPELEQYLRHIVKALNLQDAVVFEPFQRDVFGWLCDKHYIVSTSIIEGLPMCILEGMATGLKPVIHNYPGAEGVFPKEFLFDIAEQFCEQILSQDYEPAKYRKCVEEKYSLVSQLRQVNRIFMDFEKQIDSDKNNSLSGNISFARNIQPVMETSFAS